MTIDWEADGDVARVVVERMALVCEHNLAIHDLTIIVLVVKRGGCRPTPADGEVRLNAPNVVVLLAAVDEKGF